MEDLDRNIIGLVNKEIKELLRLVIKKESLNLSISNLVNTCCMLTIHLMPICPTQIKTFIFQETHQVCVNISAPFFLTLLKMILTQCEWFSLGLHNPLCFKEIWICLLNFRLVIDSCAKLVSICLCVLELFQTLMVKMQEKVLMGKHLASELWVTIHL